MAAILCQVEEVFSLLRSPFTPLDNKQIVCREFIAGFVGKKSKRSGSRSSKTTTMCSEAGAAPVVSPEHSSGDLLSKVIAAYIEDLSGSGRWTEKTKSENAVSLKLFQRFAGDLPIKSITHDLMQKFRQALLHLPANINKTPEYRERSLDEILAMDGVVPMSVTNVNKYLIQTSSMFRWAQRRGYVDRNPGEGLAVRRTIKPDEERSVYIDEDFQSLFRSPLFTEPGWNDRPERFWIPLIAMFSGMRLGEICQLYVSDIRRVASVLCFDINDEKDKRLKNISSRRTVPVHPTLLGIGFESYVASMTAQGSERLWPNLQLMRDGYGHGFSHWYQRFNREYITDDPKRVFHSFRHNVADQLKQAEVSATIISEILGHSVESMSLGRYGKRFQSDVLMNAVRRIQYSALPSDLRVLISVAEAMSIKP
ncbi:MAG: site-specific integrase [Candidatus Riflebacteria bacterium]|nr:site-specific integrase [Candidatus Riflebacteria bacterium]